MEYILKLIARFKKYKNKETCIFVLFFVICLIGANLFCAIRIKDADTEDYIITNFVTIQISLFIALGIDIISYINKNF